MYFQKFPLTLYSLDNRQSVQVIQNLLLRLVISDEIKNNFSVYDEYDIKDGETPEILAFQFYGDSNLHWLILHMNDIIDPRFDWPLDTYNLKRFAEGKYTNINGTHHYENTNGETVNGILEMFSNSEFANLSVGDVIENTSGVGIGHVTEVISTSEVLVTVSKGGFVVGDVIRKVGTTSPTYTPYTIRSLSQIPVTNFVYEDRINETKRRIKILKPQFVERIVKDFDSKLSQINE
jgi:hypothetical protein